MSGIRQGVWAYEQRRALIEKLGGKCAKCGSIKRLEIDHVNGRSYRLSALSRWQRVIIYKREAEAGLLRVLCRPCDAGGGAVGRVRWASGATSLRGALAMLVGILLWGMVLVLWGQG